VRSGKLSEWGSTEGDGASHVKALGRRRFEGRADSPREARRWLLSIAPKLGERRTDDVMVMVSELATNAVRHGGGGFEVRAFADETRLRVELADSSPDIPQLQWVPAGATSGRGLGIVESLSDEWGVTAELGGGKSVWFEVATT
jgi:anti-sigma regulatory factor (Ser/Thr protein kinase)